MINGKDVSIKSIEDAKIEAIYSDSTTIKSDSLFLNLAFGKTSVSFISFNYYFFYYYF